MPRFLDTRTGNEVNVEGHARVVHHRQRRDRFIELHDDEQASDFTDQISDDAVPAGNVDEVLDWAGDDPDRRSRALAAELGGKQRKTVIEALS